MSINITNSIHFNSKKPNFERDCINSAILFESQTPLNLTVDESKVLLTKYDIGHIVWDTNTKKRYSFESKQVAGETLGYFKPMDPIALTTQEWYNTNYIPHVGEIVIFLDYNQITDNNGTRNIPTIRIGDGIQPITSLPSLTFDYANNAQNADIAKCVEHYLYIGNKKYNGSEEVYVNVYDNSYTISNNN